MTRLRWIAGFTLYLFAISGIADEQNETDLEAFAHTYFEAMVATQHPQATPSSLEDYLALLHDDVGHTHLPYVTDDSRLPDGKASMREGMQFYLGSHDSYDAELLSVFVFNTSAVAVRYRHKASGIHPQNNQPLSYDSTMMELLEIENGKVAVIRKYHE